MADLSGDIAQQAVEPVTVTADGQTSTARPVGELVQADQYGAAKPAAKKRRRGLRFSKLINPGPLSDGGAATGAGDPFAGGYW